MLRERGDHQVGVDCRELGRGSVRAGFQQHLEPGREPIGIELLVTSRLLLPPQIQIEDAFQLTRRRQRHEVGGILEPAGLDDAVQHFRLKLAHREGGVRRVEDAGDQPAIGGRRRGGATIAAARCAIAPPPARLRPRRFPWAAPAGFRHGPGHHTGTIERETVLNGGRS